jgi:dUTP pyrophosphatase
VDYRNEWGIPVVNLSNEPVWIEDGERICQAILNKVEKIEWSEVEKLGQTERTGGFGHTGTK